MVYVHQKRQYLLQLVLVWLFQNALFATDAFSSDRTCLVSSLPSVHHGPRGLVSKDFRPIMTTKHHWEIQSYTTLSLGRRDGEHKDPAPRHKGDKSALNVSTTEWQLIVPILLLGLGGTIGMFGISFGLSTLIWFGLYASLGWAVLLDDDYDDDETEENPNLFPQLVFFSAIAAGLTATLVSPLQVPQTDGVSGLALFVLSLGGGGAAAVLWAMPNLAKPQGRERSRRDESSAPRDPINQRLLDLWDQELNKQQLADKPSDEKDERR